MTARASTFSTGAVLTLVAIALFCLGAVAVLSAFSPDLERGDDGRAHALSRSAVGYAGLVKLLEASGQRPVLLRGPPRSDLDGLLVLTPEAGADRQAGRQLVERQGSVLIILPKWQVTPHPTHRGWVRRTGLIPTSEAVSVLPDGLPPLTLTEDDRTRRLSLAAGGGRTLGRTATLEYARTVAGPDWRPVIVDAEGRAVVVTDLETGAYVLSDPDLLATHSLDDREAAATAFGLLGVLSAGQPVRFDLTLAGFSRPRGLLRLMLEPPLLGFTLALVAAGLLTGWQAATRFGPVRPVGPPLVPGKRVLADNTAALARLARREHALAPAYAVIIRRAAMRQAGVPNNLPEERADALLDRMAEAGGTQTTLADLTARAASLRRGDDVAALARALFTWKRTLTRASQ